MPYICCYNSKTSIVIFVDTLNLSHDKNYIYKYININIFIYIFQNTDICIYMYMYVQIYDPTPIYIYILLQTFSSHICMYVTDPLCCSPFIYVYQNEVHDTIANYGTKAVVNTRKYYTKNSELHKTNIYFLSCTFNFLRILTVTSTSVEVRF